MWKNPDRFCNLQNEYNRDLKRCQYRITEGMKWIDDMY